MSREGGKSGRSMTPDEAELWDRLGAIRRQGQKQAARHSARQYGAPAPPPRAQVAPEPEHKRPKPPSAAKVEQPAPKPSPASAIGGVRSPQRPSGGLRQDRHRCTSRPARRAAARRPLPAACLSIRLPAKWLQDRARRYRQGRGIGQPRSSGGRLGRTAPRRASPSGTAMVGGARAAYRRTQFHLGRCAPWR